MNFLKADPNEVHFMVDIETLSTKSNAAITEIGAVCINQSEFVDNFHEHCYDVTGDVDPVTTAWRKENNLPCKASDECFGVAQVLQQFFTWIKLNLKEKQTPVMWCKGTDFDKVIIESACERWGITSEIPWKYNKFHDLRTSFVMFPQFKIPKDQVKHNGLDDALMQAQQIVSIANHVEMLEEAENFARREGYAG